MVSDAVTCSLDVEVVDVDFCVGVRSLSSAQSGCNVALPECVEEDILAEGAVVVEWLWTKDVSQPSCDLESQ